MYLACSRHPQVQQVHLHQGPQDNDPDVFLEDNTICQTHEKPGIICVSTEGTAAPMETLFSLSSYSKPKIKNKMMTDNLNSLDQFSSH